MQEQPYIKYPILEGYEHISKVVDDTNRRLDDIREGRIKPILTSSKKETDKIGGYFPTDQLVIAARTGMGKTAYMLNMLGDFMDQNINPYYYDKIIILYDSWEMPGWRNMLRMYSRANKLSVKEFLDYNRAMENEAFARILEVSNQFRNKPLYMRSISQSIKEWYETKYEIQNANPDKLIINVVDHSRLVTKTTERSEEELITNFMKMGMKVKLEMNQFNVFLSQMNRAVETAGKRDEMGQHTPVSSDIFGSDGVFQCADVVLALHRPGYYGLIEWNKIATGKKIEDPEAPDNLMIECLLKQRDGWTGNLLRYHNLAHNEFYDELPSGLYMPKEKKGLFGTSNSMDF